MRDFEKKELRQLCAAGYSFSEIRDEVSASDSTIRRYMKLFSPPDTGRIIAAAILWDGVMYTGDRHGNILQYLVKIGQLKDIKKDKVTYEMQGFIDQDGNWYTREGARELAIKSKQIKPDHGTLYSEDLW